MSSIIDGYEYDIFISYRQNDNKYDGWVTEFVDNLNKELEATIKDKISVYYDSNPHDGLLETNVVSLSLKDKLKCLIFIPILSKTYCDSNSFAWKNEFLAFINNAEQDGFGLNIKLANSNFAGRILPVRIYDLDPEDIKLVENHLGFIRSIDFVYHSQGVNRPLRQRDDDAIQNTKQLIYRDQINKIANTIDEILRGLKRVQAKPIKENNDETIPSADSRTTITELSGSQFKIDKTSGSDDRSTERTVRINKKKIIFTSSPLVLILAFLALFIFSTGSKLPFSKRDWIVITDFENLTDNSVFDKSLYTAFSLSTSQSSYINIYPRSRMLETLARMKIKDQTTVDEKTGREIAVREGINLCIVPSISEVGNRYAIAAKIMEAKSGNILRSEMLNAENKDEILSKLDKLSKKIRRNLGESRYIIASQDKPLKKVTTSSLEALKLYSLGIDHNLMMDFESARKYYESALKIDTGFTSAKASLGNLLIERFDPAKGRELLTQAVKSVDNLTERERLGILAFYAVNVEKNLTKGIDYAKTRIELYPDDAAARNNLGWYYMNSGRFEEALKEYKATVRIFSDMALPYGGIGWIYLEKLGKMDSALVWAEKMISDIPDNAYGYFYLGSAYLGLDSLSRAETAFRKAHGLNPSLLMNEYRLAHTYRIQGRYKEAIEILKKVHNINKDEVSTIYDLAINYQSMGNQKEAMKYSNEFRRIATEEWTKTYPDDPGTYFAIGAITARSGDFESSRKALRKAIEIDSTGHEKFAELLCLQGKIPEALSEIEKALENGYRDLVWLKINPDLQALRYDIRFRDLIDKYFK
jgi:tetratricopeptide (TPR) repeat protein